ncbi:hypothetical protein ACM9XC_07315 [Xanthomonas sacchari]
MHPQTALIERALVRSKSPSYGALARKLGVTSATMSQWRSGDSKLSHERIAQFSEMAGDDPGIWLMAMMAEECNVTTLRSSIRNIIQKMGGAAAGVLVLAMAIGTNPIAEKEKSIQISDLHASGADKMYLM